MMALIATSARAASGTDRIAWPGRPVTYIPASWPVGVEAIVNDPVRVDGWLPWFTELPNDIQYFEMDIRTTDQLNQILAKLSTIDCGRRELRLHPGSFAPGYFGAQSRSRCGAVFYVGDQNRLNTWYAALPVVASGEREFGVSCLSGCPTAAPPTVSVYVLHPAVDLAKLRVPAGVTVVSEVTDVYRHDHPGDPGVAKIDAAVRAAVARETGVILPDAGRNP
jgi:hypothetical protein